MKAGFYIRYTTRSLARGGQRTLLAILCIGVGVMAIVGLGLASGMVERSLTSNVRAANGGDISARSDLLPFNAGDLAFFQGLRARGLVSAYTAVNEEDGQVSRDATHASRASLAAVDPRLYPLDGNPTFIQPPHGDLRVLLVPGGQAVLRDSLATELGASVGSPLHVVGEGGRVLDLRVAGIIKGGGSFAGGSDLYLSQDDAQAAAPSQPFTYHTVYMTAADDAQATRAAQAVRAQYPLATVRTVDDALKARQEQVDLVRKLLDVIGLLALLIGGFGVVNTMQVLLTRRRVEIAMLKTMGYRRRDLFVLFGLEAALLGLAGGIAGSLVGLALSWVVRALIQNAFRIILPFTVDGTVLLSGVVVGVATACIFGLMPIVRAAWVRPQAVLRDLPTGRHLAAVLVTLGLFAVLLTLFTVLAGVVLRDARWAIVTVGGAFVGLVVLGLVFSGVIWLLGRIAVPERLTARYVFATTASLALAALVARAVPSIGGLLMAVALLGYALPFLPLSWRISLKLALRNVGRQRGRATTTLLALFVGVFAVGTISVLGQDLRDKINTALATQIDFNVVALTPARYKAELEAQYPHLPGLKSRQAIAAAQTIPVAINGRPLADLLKGAPANGSQDNLGIRGSLAYLLGLGGYDLATGQRTAATVKSGEGRDLGPADAASDHVLANAVLHRLQPLRLRVGDRVTLLSDDRRRRQTVTIVGFYTPSALGLDPHFEPLLAPRALVQRLGGPTLAEIVSLKIDPARTKDAVRLLTKRAPHTLSFDLTDLGALINSILTNLIILLTALASLALFAGVIIIANAVGLAMLERRRELGILKSVGYTSRRVLTGVLIENGIVGALGGLLGMAAVAISTAVLARTLFKTSLELPGPIVLAIIALSTAIALLTAGLVAWRAVRVRPLEVLRYE